MFNAGLGARADHDGFAAIRDERPGSGQRGLIVGAGRGDKALLAVGVFNSQGHFHWIILNAAS